MSRKMGPSGNPSVQDKLRSRDKSAKEQRIRDFESVAMTPNGRRFLYDLIFGRCGVMSIYPLQDSGIYRHEGRRGLGIELAHELQENFAELYVKMVTERIQDQHNEKILKDAALMEDSRSEDV